MKTPKLNLGASTILKIVGGVLAVGAYIVSSALDTHNQNELKAELKDDLLKELSNDQNQETI